jgi:uncharacterized protein
MAASCPAATFARRIGGVAFGAAAAAAVLVAAVPARAQESPAPPAPPAQQAPSPAPRARVIVIGEGSVSAAPDYAVITSGVTTRAKTAKEATDTNSKTMAAVTAALVSAGIAQKDIQTSRFSVQPVYTPAQTNVEPKLSGFSVANEVSVTIRQIGNVGDILDRLIAAGATDIGNVEFLHSDPSKTLDQARQAAVADAKRKAELYAHDAGLTLGPVVSITEQSAAVPGVPMARALAAPVAVPIAAGEDTLRVRITVGFAIAP